MLAFVKLSIEAHHAVIDGVVENDVIILHGKRQVFSAFESRIIYGLLDVCDAVIAGGVKLKGFSNKRGFRLINHDTAVLAVVEISKGSKLRPDAIAELLAHASLNILREIIDVIFALAKGNVQHEFAVSRNIKSECRKFEVLDFSDIDEIDDASAINAVASKPVGMPSENALHFSCFNLRQHGVEYRASGSFGGAAFDEFLDNLDAFPFREFAQFEKLRFD